jgi:hypothetical protein
LHTTFCAAGRVGGFSDGAISSRQAVSGRRRRAQQS